MDCKGFRIYRGNTGYMPLPQLDMPTCDARSQSDLILDAIFAKDENGWPSTSISRFLSSKTSDDVRKFIEEKILFDVGQPSSNLPTEVVQKFRDLKSEFIAEASRNRYESIEDYEIRLQKIIERDDFESISARAKALRSNFFDSLRKNGL